MWPRTGVRARRRTFFSLLGAFAIAAVIFLYFQMFSHKLLDGHQQLQESNGDLPGVVHWVPARGAELQGPRDDLPGVVHLAPTVQAQINNKDCVNNICKTDRGPEMVDGQEVDALLYPEILAHLPLGASRKLAATYLPDTDNMFTCIHSKERLPYAEVNDDYCDCSDGSDEPGTSACTNNRFYCTFQGLVEHVISSSHVNDGICDCCDGSDEPKNRSLPAHVKLSGGPFYGYHQTPCHNRCQQEISDAHQMIQIRHQGAALKQNYVKAGQAPGVNPDQLYGEHGEYYLLSQNCYDTVADKYEYKVCPFREIRQQAFPEPSMLIGQVPQWVQDENHCVLRMSHGDSTQCPGRIKRETLIQFQCGLSDVVESVRESEICQYTIVFRTPAAC